MRETRRRIWYALTITFVVETRSSAVARPLQPAAEMMAVVRQVVDEMIEKEPERRPSAGQVAARLEAILRELRRNP